MPPFLGYLSIAAYTLGAIAVVCWFVAIGKIGRSETLAKVAGYATGGICLLCSGATFIVPDEFSPKETQEGPITEFRHVDLDMDRSYFEFTISDAVGGRHKLRSNHFDAGFYSGDPVIYDGVAVKATYLRWTGEVIGLTAISGRHAGWTYSKPIGLGSWLLVVAGVVFMMRGTQLLIDEPVTKSHNQPLVKGSNSTSILGL